MLNVRLAAASDEAEAVKLVGGLLVELGGAPLPPEEVSPVFHDLIADGDAGFIVVGEAEGRLCAVCTVSFLQTLRTRGRYAIIQEMFVDPDVRSTGIGMDVLRFALDHAVASGCSLVELGTPAQGVRQIQFYKRAGFTEVGARLRWRP